MKELRAITVDVDGTLYGVRRMRVAWRLRRERGLLVALVAAREKIRREPTLTDLEALERREAELVAPSFNLSFEEARARLRRLKDKLPEALCRGMRPFPGVRETLLAALKQGLALGAVSDFDPEPKLRFLGLDDLPWTAMVGADALGALKPQTRPFEEACRQFALRPEEVLHIGDREGLDVLGALEAGLRAWRFRPERGAGVSEAELVFSRWRPALFDGQVLAR